MWDRRFMVSFFVLLCVSAWFFFWFNTSREINEQRFVVDVSSGVKKKDTTTTTSSTLGSGTAPKEESTYVQVQQFLKQNDISAYPKKDFKYFVQKTSSAPDEGPVAERIKVNLRHVLEMQESSGTSDWDVYIAYHVKSWPITEQTVDFNNLPLKSKINVNIPGVSALARKAGICKVMNKAAELYGKKYSDILPTCIDTPANKSELLAKIQKTDFPVWLWKPSDLAGGHGVQLHDRSLRDFTRGKVPGVFQAYIHNPVMLKNEWIEKNQKRFANVKADLRLWGVVTSWDPLRVYLSTTGLYRTAHPFRNFTLASFDPVVHVTNFGIKKEETYNGVRLHSMIMKDFFERDFALTGSFDRIFQLVQHRYGLHPDEVWKGIKKQIEKLYIIGQKEVTCRRTGFTCGRQFTTFTIDAGLDQTGHLWVFETHVGMSIKQQDDEELGVTFLMQERGQWPALFLALSYFAESQFVQVASKWLHTQIEKGRIPRLCSAGERTYPNFKCLDEAAVQTLLEMAAERKMLCRTGMESLLSNWVEYEDVLDAETKWYYSVFSSSGLRELADASPKSCRDHVLLRPENSDDQT